MTRELNKLQKYRARIFRNVKPLTKEQHVQIEEIVIRDGVVTSHTPGYDPDLGFIYNAI